MRSSTLLISLQLIAVALCLSIPQLKHDCDCPAGTESSNGSCRSVCPFPLSDNGASCIVDYYSRGSEYSWRFGDSLDDSGQYRRCEGDYGKGNCEKIGVRVYPKCIDGFSAHGCCICRAAKPDCAALGLIDDGDMSCAKKITNC